MSCLITFRQEGCMRSKACFRFAGEFDLERGISDIPMFAMYEFNILKSKKDEKGTNGLSTDFLGGEQLYFDFV